MRIQEKKTVSGKLLEVDFYPVWKNGHRVPEKAAAMSPPEKIKYNHRQCEKRIIRLSNKNFDDEDNIMHPTFSPKNAPSSAEEARKVVKLYFDRVRRKRKSELKKITKQLDELPDTKTFDGLREKLIKKKRKLSQPFKYIYVLEEIIYQRGKYAGLVNYHFHIFLTGGLDRREYEKLWKGGVRVNCDTFQPETFGPEAIGRYMVKAHVFGRKAYVCSRNIEDPDEKITKSRFSAEGIKKLAKERVDDSAYWEKRYKGYRLLKTYPRFNEYNGYWYMSVVMYADSGGEPPKWNFDSWADDF